MIHRYTRAEAIRDGVLRDVSTWASADQGFIGGFTIPVAVTASVWRDIADIPDKELRHQDVRGRAHDVLFMASMAARRNPKLDRVRFGVILARSLSSQSLVHYQLLVGPGDAGEAVATIMQENED